MSDKKTEMRKEFALTCKLHDFQIDLTQSCSIPTLTTMKAKMCEVISSILK